ncbi:Nitrogen permease regulator 2 [Coemansia sp. RSA 922]|nr:Nitrogen permease regulator 2 [Coemansia sp. S3946]KAJ2045705.1 Nitrogen permease regulator 2 [Coemansia sp. S16]KAJ2066870.1 Nitrogen permease regulator 2 [Coemansia sp. S155-1]KAJ2116623.1 Nitrogen permease regulator 2 [Coemansia sp. RSA 922]
MGCGTFPKIEAIFLAQFHPDLGPIVRLSVPEDAVELDENRGYNNNGGTSRGDDDSRYPESSVVSFGNSSHLGLFHGGEQPTEVVELIKRPTNPKAVTLRSDKIDFNAIQALVIPKLTLFEKLITVNTGRFKVMCYPVAILGNYARNAFIFNMCFAFDINADTKCFGPVVKRVGCLLKELEISSGLLSDEDGERPLMSMMRQLVTKLNDHGECQIELDLKGLSQSLASTGISIKLFPYYGSPRDIAPYHVPVRTIDFEMAKLKSVQTVSQADIPDDIMWDLVLDRVMKHMDNVNHVRRIALLTKIREETVVLALRHLDYYGCIVLADIFQFGNIYEAQYQIMDLYRQAWLQRECYNYVTRDGAASDVQAEELLRLYSTIQKRKTVAEWVLENEVDVERIDVRRFIVFGVIHQLLRRVHCYPVLCGPAKVCDEERSVVAEDNGETASPGDDSPGNGGLEKRLVEMLDGTHHMDEICVVEEKDAATLRQEFDSHGNIEYMYL